MWAILGVSILQNILIVEDHLDAGVAMNSIVSRAFAGASIDNVPTLQRAREKISENSYDLVVLDLGLPDGKGENFILEITSSQPNAYIVISTIHDESDRLLLALENGAKGYLLKEQDPDYLVSEFEGILSGKPPLAPAITRRLLEVVRNRNGKQGGGLSNDGSPEVAKVATSISMSTQNGSTEALTDREKEVLGLIGKGFSRPEIAGILGISKHTVATHLRKVYDKLSITNRSEATLMAVELGLC